MYNVKNTGFSGGSIRYQDVYVASKKSSKYDDLGNVIPQYSVPVKHRMNVMPLTESIDIQTFGENSNSVKVTVLGYKMYNGIFKNFDVAYIGITPDGEKTFGENSNYTITVREQNDIIKLYFQEKIKGE